jgi:hypothetical protein
MDKVACSGCCEYVNDCSNRDHVESTKPRYFDDSLRVRIYLEVPSKVGGARTQHKDQAEGKTPTTMMPTICLRAARLRVRFLVAA